MLACILFLSCGNHQSPSRWTVIGNQIHHFFFFFFLFSFSSFSLFNMRKGAVAQVDMNNLFPPLSLSWSGSHPVYDIGPPSSLTEKGWAMRRKCPLNFSCTTSVICEDNDKHMRGMLCNAQFFQEGKPSYWSRILDFAWSLLLASNRGQSVKHCFVIFFCTFFARWRRWFSCVPELHSHKKRDAE